MYACFFKLISKCDPRETTRCILSLLLTTSSKRKHLTLTPASHASSSLTLVSQPQQLFNLFKISKSLSSSHLHRPSYHSCPYFPSFPSYMPWFPTITTHVYSLFPPRSFPQSYIHSWQNPSLVKSNSAYSTPAPKHWTQRMKICKLASCVHFKFMTTKLRSSALPSIPCTCP